MNKREVHAAALGLDSDVDKYIVRAWVDYSVRGSLGVDHWDVLRPVRHDDIRDGSRFTMCVCDSEEDARMIANLLNKAGQ